MADIDTKIKQCEDDIETLQQTLKELKKKKEKSKWIAAIQGYDGKLDARILIHLANLTPRAKKRLLEAINQNWISFNADGEYCYASETGNGLNCYGGETKIIF